MTLLRGKKCPTCLLERREGIRLCPERDPKDTTDVLTRPLLPVSPAVGAESLKDSEDIVFTRAPEEILIVLWLAYT